MFIDFNYFVFCFTVSAISSVFSEGACIFYESKVL